MKRKATTFWVMTALVWPIALARSTEAAVLIKTNRVTICVTDTKHPEACKTSASDGNATVSEEALEALQGELGQGATIMQAIAAARPSGAQGRHHRHSEQDQTAPAQ